MSLTSQREDERAEAGNEFCAGTSLGIKESRSTLRKRLNDVFRNSGHRWMWDYSSLTQALSDHGFVNIKRFLRGDCEDEMFLRPEREHQFGDSNQPTSI